MSKIKFEDYRDIQKEDELLPTASSRRAVHPRKMHPNDEERTNFRITRCCLNCKFYFGAGPSYSRGGCFHPYTLRSKAKQIKWPTGKKLSCKEFLLLLRPAHATCLCSAHQFRGEMNHVKKYCNAEYIGDDVW